MIMFMFRLAILDVDIILILGGFEGDSFGGMVLTELTPYAYVIIICSLF